MHRRGHPGAYWRKLKQRLIKEGSGVVTNCHGLKLTASDGKSYKTDCFSTKDTLRLIQSIPSPKAEPFKMWLAQVGAERVDEIADPEKAILRGAEYYRAKGYTEGWINQRLQAIEMRKELTIGLFHPIVIKAEYYWGKGCWWLFAAVGLGFCIASLLSKGVLSAILGVIGFSCFWSILELFQQEKRVAKGWFPSKRRNEKRVTKKSNRT